VSRIQRVICCSILVYGTRFLERRVKMVNLEELSRRHGLEPLEQLLTLVVRPQGELAPVSRALVERQPELSGMNAPILWKRLPRLSLEEVMTMAGGVWLPF
jgi:hypothetical protein